MCTARADTRGIDFHAADTACDDEVPFRLFRRHDRLKLLAQEMRACAKCGALQNLPALLQEFDQLCAEQAADRNEHMFGYLEACLKADCGRRAKLRQMRKAVERYVIEVRQFARYHLEHPVTADNVHVFCRELDRMVLNPGYHAVHAGRYFFPLYVELGWDSGTLTLPPPGLDLPMELSHHRVRIR